ncbi:MAG TPA: porin [Pararobbsia sp.]|nr:porin [Pararobbsia sp.]
MNRAITAMVLLGLPIAAQAQSSVTMFGLIDAGITYTSNQGGHHSFTEQTGIQAPDLFGVHGVEDLGGGYSALFVLDGSFALNTGAQSGGGIFGRESYVGISTPYGALTLGNQFDYMYDNLSVARWGNQIPYVSLYQLPGGPFSRLGSPLGTFDYTRMAGGVATNNTVKFTSNTYAGFNVGAMYGFSNLAGGTNTDNMMSFGANYAAGPIRLNAAYTYARQDSINDGHNGIRNFGFGGRYDFGKLALDGVYVNTRNTFNGAHVDTFEAGALYSFAPDVFAYLQYIYADGNAVLTDNKSNQIGLTLDYLLSKRTDVYVNWVYQHASGNADVIADISGAPGASSNGTQTIVRVAMRHLF